MEILKNQTLYRCSYCNRRKLTKRGCLLHENKYCTHPDSPHMVIITDKTSDQQKDCPHNNIETIWAFIPGEAVKQPDYDVCIDCNLKF